MLFELILTIMFNDKIKEVNLHTAAPTLNACMSDQPSMAKYIGEHPGTSIVKWHCVPQGMEANL